MKTDVRIAGVDVQRRRLQGLPGAVQRKVLRQGVQVGAKEIRDAIRSRAPVARAPHYRGGRKVRPGTLKRAVVYAWARELSGQAKQSYVVTLLRGKKYQRMGRKGTLDKDAYYWPWVEFGHRYIPRSISGARVAYGKTLVRMKRGTVYERTLKRGMSSLRALRARGGFGRVPPHPFFWPAYRGVRARAESAARGRIRQLIGEVLK